MVDLTKEQSGIRNNIFVAGKVFRRPPNQIVITPKRFEKMTRSANFALHVDRPFLGAGMPNIRNRHDITLPWSDIREDELIERLGLMGAVGDPFPVGLWKQVYDVFSGDGANKTFYLQRRQLLPYIPPQTLFEDYPTKVATYDRPLTDPAAVRTDLDVVQKTAATIDSGDPASDEAWVESDGHQIGGLWVSKLRLGTAAPAASDCLAAIYLPLYMVVVDTENPRPYPAALVEQKGFKLQEFG